MARQLSPNREISAFVDDTIEVRQETGKEQPRDQEPEVPDPKFDTERQIEGQGQGVANLGRQEFTIT